MTKVKTKTNLPNNKHVIDNNNKAKSLLTTLRTNYKYEVYVETSVVHKPKSKEVLI